MRRVLHRTAWAAVVAALALTAHAPASPPDAAQKADDQGTFVVHEWGTFLTVQGSDGTALGGMVASEEELPPFVLARGLESYKRTQILSKMETPVTYFYTDRPRKVSVLVRMPQGVLTHWFPMVRDFTDPREKVGPKGTYLNWGNFEVVPATFGPHMKPGMELPTPYRVKQADPWTFARYTDAAFVKVFSRDTADWQYDYEKFLFYRGLGTMKLPLEVRSDGSTDGQQLDLANRGPHALTGMFLVRVGKESISFARLDDLAGAAAARVGLPSLLAREEPLNDGVHNVKKAVAQALVKSGLFQKEADAMVNSWEKSYFRTEGLRVLYVLPRQTVDEYIPITITPKPDRLERVMVGRTEILTPDVERAIEGFVANLGSDKVKIRDAASVGLAKLGRLGEPALRRVAGLTKSPEVRSRALTLIKAAEANP